MTQATIVIVSGLPASGKTTLARRLADDLRLPLISRDDIKERLFDRLGWSNRTWSCQLGAASWELLFWAVETQLAAGQSCIVESNFHPDHDRLKILDLVQRFNVTTIEVHCHAAGTVLVDRYLSRVTDKTRHPGHVDHVTIDEQRDKLLAVRPQPMDLGGHTVLVDTTNPTRIDYDCILANVRAALGEDPCRSRG